MTSTRINGIKIHMTVLTAYELDAIERMVTERLETAEEDLAKITRERERRNQFQLRITNQGE